MPGDEERRRSGHQPPGDPGNHESKLSSRTQPNERQPSPPPSPSCPSRACGCRPRSPPEEVERRIQQAARELGRQMRVPGFRKGKVPPPVVIRRLGREAVLDEALRSALGAWYADAIDGAGIAPVGEPELDVPSELPAEGAAAAVLDRDRRAPRRQARPVQGPRGRAPRAGRGGRPDRRGDRAPARPAGHARDRRAAGRARRSRGDRLRRHGRRRGVRGRHRRATSCSSSARAG